MLQLIMDKAKEVSSFYDNVHKVLQFPDHSVTSHRMDAFQVACEDNINFAGIEAGQTIVDAGCGLGSFSLFVAERMKTQMHALSISPMEHQIAKDRLVGKDLQGDVAFYLGDFHNLDKIFPANHFDLVVFNESFEHSFDKEKALLACNKILKPHQKVFLKYHVKLHPKGLIEWLKFKIQEKREQDHLRIYQHLTMEELNEVAAKTGFKIIKVAPPAYNFIDYEISNDLVKQANEKLEGFNFKPIKINFTSCTNILMEKC